MVIFVSLVALGFRVGIVVALAVPLTLSAVFVVMMVTGRDFDRITLGALIISLGLLVDDAIIAIEMMVVRMEEGADRIEAATYAWSATAAPMLTGTLVTIAGFLPVGFAASTAGEYAGNIFWVVAFSLIISWIVAVTFTPYLGVKLLPEHQEGGGRPRGDLRHARTTSACAGSCGCRSTTSGWPPASPWRCSRSRWSAWARSSSSSSRIPSAPSSSSR